MNEPEVLMKQGFEHFFKTNDCFTNAIVLYTKRNNDEKADKLNADNLKKATLLMAQAYDCISEIYENDINI